MAVYQLPQTDVVGLIVAWAGNFGSRRFVDLANTVSWQDGLVAIFEGGAHGDRQADSGCTRTLTLIVSSLGNIPGFDKSG
jgi:hypothetical protein